MLMLMLKLMQSRLLVCACAVICCVCVWAAESCEHGVQTRVAVLMHTTWMGMHAHGRDGSQKKHQQQVISIVHLESHIQLLWVRLLRVVALVTPTPPQSPSAIYWPPHQRTAAADHARDERWPNEQPIPVSEKRKERPQEGRSRSWE